MNACLALDVGGSFVKLAPMGEDCAPLIDTPWQVPMDSGGDAAAILGALSEAVRCGLEAAREAGNTVNGISVSIPGPFDYAGGISRMTHKFAAIRDLPLRPVLAACAGQVPVVFLHDSTAFMLGECFLGAGVGAMRPVGMMLGTGFGFAVMQDGKVCVNAGQTPALSLWGQAYRDGIVEDYVSRRAIRARYAAKRPDAGDPDVREIADRAKQGETAARETFAETGALLGDILRPHLTALRCDRMMLGGQIARSAELILPSLTAELPTPVVVAAYLDDAALRGAALYARRGKAALVRETTAAAMLRRAKEA